MSRIDLNKKIAGINPCINAGNLFYHFIFYLFVTTLIRSNGEHKIVIDKMFLERYY